MKSPLLEEVYLKIDIVEKIIMHDTYVYASNFIKDKFIKLKQVVPLQEVSNLILLTNLFTKNTFNCKGKRACVMQSIVVFYTVPNFMPTPFKI